MLTLLTLLLWISPGLGQDGAPECVAWDPRFCSSPCGYLWGRCAGDVDCSLDLCSYLQPPGGPRLQRCWNLLLDCGDDDHGPVAKRGTLNRNMAYLLLKLHPFVNQTSQFGFLTSGRFRRISGSLGNEFLGKRGESKPKGGADGSRAKGKPSSAPQFYSLPLNKLSKAKILKREEDLPGAEKRAGIPGNGRVVLGSEFLGKRASGLGRRLTGNEFLGKRGTSALDGSEFLGKRAGVEYLEGNEFLGKRDQEELLGGTELLGKKSSALLGRWLKRYGSELLGKRLDWEEAAPGLLAYGSGSGSEDRVREGRTGEQPLEAD